MKFSVIVPIYNVEKYVRKCIESILNQTYRDFEVILVDDGSPDQCPQICDEYAQKDKRIKVIHKKNEGLVAARNTGIKSAIGEYICYVDGDDWIAENLLETVWNRAIKKYDIEMVVYSAVRQYDNHQEEIPKSVPEGLYNKEKLYKDVYPYMMYDSRKPFCIGLIFPVAWNKIFKREFLLKHYCKEEKIRMGEDNAFVFECLYRANSVYFIDEKLYYYNQLNTESIVHSYDRNRFKNNTLLMSYIEEKIGGESVTLDNQINALKVYWLIMAVFHEIKSGQSIKEARKHIKKEIKNNKSLGKISLKGIPNSARIFIILLRMHFYYTVLVLSKIVNEKRN